ncbi:MAG: S8 family serine peptidase, partial [Lachnospiraceae bacterium]|nr:S8 family serine peptidase [Lachnospiraceae bacterium]
DKTVLKLISSDTLSTEELIELYSGKPGVLFAEPNYIIKAETYAGKEEPDREVPILGTTGHSPDMTDLQHGYGSGPVGMNVPDWNEPEKKNSDEDTVIAILDSGIDYEHEDLEPVMWDKGEDYPELTALGGGKYGIFTAADHNIGMERPQSDPIDLEEGHGTHCAGIAAAAWNNYGISGVANGAKLMAVKIFFDPETGNAYNSDIVEGFNYVLTAKKAGVKVASANCSFGSPLKSLSTAYCARELGENGVITCFASGNDTMNCDDVFWDSTITGNVPSVITVDAMDKGGDPVYFTDYGIRNTHIFAPGTEILSTLPNPLSEPMLDSRYSKPVKTVSGNELYDNYDAGAKAFDYTANTENGTKIEFKDNKLVISGTDLLKKDSITKETIAENEPDRVAVMTIKPRGKLKELPKDGKYSLVLNRHAKTIPDIYWYLQVYVKTKDGKWERPNYTYQMMETPLCEYYPLDVSVKGNAFDLDDLQIRLVLAYIGESEVDTLKLEEAVLEEFWITDDPQYPYGYKDGTSMATPAVAGEVAILAKAFPDDSAAKRAARVLAGARRSEVFRDLCVSGGAANVKNSLDESTYTPVVNDIYADGEGLHIEGFFFGKKNDTEVSLTQGGENYSTGDGSLVLKSTRKVGKDTEELLLEVPKGLKRNEEVYVTVTDRARPDDRKSFSRYLTPGDPEGILENANIYQRIAVPEGLFSSYTIINRAASLDGSLYFTGYDSSYDHDNYERSHKFDTFRFKDGEWEKVKSAVSANGCIATFGGELVYSDYFDHKTLCFHDGKGNIRKTEFKPEKGNVAIPEDRPWILNAPDDKDFQIDLYYDGKDMILIRNTFIPQEDGSEIYYSSVYLLDPLSGKGTYLGDLKNGYSSQVVIAHEEIAGKPNTVYVIGMVTKKGKLENARKKDFAAEKFTVSDFSPETLNDAAPEGFSFYNTERGFWSGCGVKDGIYLTGPHTVNGDGYITNVAADNYYLSFKDLKKGFKPCSKKICDTALEFPVTAQGYGKVYFLGIKDTGYIMGYTDEDTLPHYGDSKEPEKDPGLSDPASPLHRTDGKDIESV